MLKNKKIIITIIVLVFIGLILLYSRFIATSGLKIKEYKVVDTGLSDNFYGLKIAHITDLHYGRTVNEKQLKVIVDKINLTKPDIVVLTGDLIDRDTKLENRDIIILKNELNRIVAKLGKYAIEGNHDAVFSDWVNIISGSNFTDLNNTYELIYQDTLEPILITGVSSNIMYTTPIEEKMKDVNAYYASLNETSIKPSFNILLVHEPDFIDQIDITNYNLVLAGHSHNGQVRFPLFGSILLPKGATKYYDEHYIINDVPMYISSGIGTSVLNFRLFNKPSFNLYRIVNK